MTIREWSKLKVLRAYRTWGWREARAKRVLKYLQGRKTSNTPRTALSPARKRFLLRLWRENLAQASRMRSIFRAELERRRTVIVSREQVGYQAARPFQHVSWGNVRIVVHHTVTPASQDAKAAALMIDGAHRARGYNGIGYHLLVHQDGSIVEGRPAETVGAHAGTFAGNRQPGVALIGDYRSAKVTPAQVAALEWIEKEYLPSLGATVIGRVGHGDLYPTTCPGPNAGVLLG